MEKAAGNSYRIPSGATSSKAEEPSNESSQQNVKYCNLLAVDD
jgi:hypothetical protein